MFASAEISGLHRRPYNDNCRNASAKRSAAAHRSRTEKEGRMSLTESGLASFSMPPEDLSHVPFRVYTDPELYALEQERIFRGATWNFLALECEIPNVGDYKTTYVGDAPVIVVRSADGINALVNRCAHKGALICYKHAGNVREFNCVYHNWTYDLAGKLTGVAFKRGVAGKGGVGPDFDQASHGLERLRVETYRGLIFGTYSKEVPPFRDYVGS